MTRTKLGLMGLCAVVIGVLAISAGTAQGALSWLVLNAAGTVATEIKENEKGEINLFVKLLGEKDSSHLVFLSTISKLMISIACNFVTPFGLHFAAVGTLSTGGLIEFSGCEVYSGSFTLPPISNVLSTTKLPCIVRSNGRVAGTISTEGLKGKLVLNASKEVLIDIEPEAVGTPLAVLLFQGEECALPEEDSLTGSLFFKDCEKRMLVHSVRHLLEEGSGSTLKLGTSAATLLGSFWIRLNGEHAALAWAAMDA